MTIKEIYEKYKIMPALQLHQLRVAAVAKIICDNFDFFLNTDDIIKACLLHDMGNLLKFDLNRFPEFLEPKGYDYWAKAQKELEEKFNTTDEHIATAEIAKELGVSEKTFDYLKSIGFSKSTIIASDNDFNHKIANYSDQRVDPFGVVLIDERLDEGQKRYNLDPTKTKSGEDFVVLANDLKKIEAQIFEHTSIKPSDITNENIQAIFPELEKITL